MTDKRNRPFLVHAALLLGGILLLALPATAQYDRNGTGNPPPTGKQAFPWDPFRIGFGVQFTPFGGARTGRIDFAVDLGGTTGAFPVASGIYVDISQNGRTGKRLNAPASLNQLVLQDVLGEAAFMGAGVMGRAYPGRTAKAVVQPYVGLGAGIYTLQLVRYIGTVPPGAKVIDNSRRFGGKFFTGVDFRGGPFVEADFVYPGRSDARTFGLLAGYRF